jgi:N-hydroxyarylamine O-acetyltransferase
MDTAEFDLDGYLERIGYDGDRRVGVDTLRAIVVRHAGIIPFENLNPLLRWPVRLDTKSLQDKLVREQRGGYCYEQNLLLRHALQALGFRTAGLAARVLWEAPEGQVNPRSHMLLRVDLDEGPYIADVGFGGQTLTGPLRLDAGVEQSTPYGPFRLVQADSSYILQASIRDVWKRLYSFDLSEQLLPDYEVSSWYLCNHPESHFIKGLVAARAAPDRRYALRNNKLAVHYMDGRTTHRLLGASEELRDVLQEEIGLRLPDHPEVDAMLDRITRKEQER